MNTKFKDDGIVREALRMMARHLQISEPTEENVEKFKRIQIILENEDLTVPVVDFSITFKEWFEEHKYKIESSKLLKLLNGIVKYNHHENLANKSMRVVRMRHFYNMRNFGPVTGEELQRLFHQTGWKIQY